MRKSQQQQQQQQPLQRKSAGGVSTPPKTRRSPRDSAVSDAAAATQVTGSPTDSRRVSQVLLAGDDEGYQDVLNQLKIEALLPLIEDLSDWLNTVLGRSTGGQWIYSISHRTICKSYTMARTNDCNSRKN
jgi:hypothetical protein